MEGKYEVKNGKIIYNEERGSCVIEYEEVWGGGETVDALRARVKSNAKFQCESAGGFEQKATNETKNLPEGFEERMGESAKAGVKKYYLGDKDAAVDAPPVVGAYFQVTGEDAIHWADDSSKLEEYMTFGTYEEYLAHRTDHGYPEVLLCRV